MRAGQADLALGVKDRLGRSSNSPEFTSHAQGQARIELTDALGLTRSRFIEDRAPAALLHQIKAPLKKIEASSTSMRRMQVKVGLVGGARDWDRASMRTQGWSRFRSKARNHISKDGTLPSGYRSLNASRDASQSFRIRSPHCFFVVAGKA
jgi:hypothetical protein